MKLDQNATDILPTHYPLDPTRPAKHMAEFSLLPSQTQFGMTGGKKSAGSFLDNLFYQAGVFWIFTVICIKIVEKQSSSLK